MVLICGAESPELPPLQSIQFTNPFVSGKKRIIPVDSVLSFVDM